MCVLATVGRLCATPLLCCSGGLRVPLLALRRSRAVSAAMSVRVRVPQAEQHEQDANDGKHHGRSSPAEQECDDEGEEVQAGESQVRASALGRAPIDPPSRWPTSLWEPSGPVGSSSLRPARGHSRLMRDINIGAHQVRQHHRLPRYERPRARHPCVARGRGPSRPGALRSCRAWHAHARWPGTGPGSCRCRSLASRAAR